MVDAWNARDAAARYEEIAGRNHFDVIAPLAEPGSAMTRRILELAAARPG